MTFILIHALSEEVSAQLSSAPDSAVLRQGRCSLDLLQLLLSNGVFVSTWDFNFVYIVKCLFSLVVNLHLPSRKLTDLSGREQRERSAQL